MVKKPVRGSDHVCFWWLPQCICCTGPIPEALGALSNLTGLYLPSNQLTGEPEDFACIRLLVPPSHLEPSTAYKRVYLYTERTFFVRADNNDW